MKTLRCMAMGLMLMSAAHVAGQEIRFSAGINDADFATFSKTVSTLTGTRFFYQGQSVQNLKITAAGVDLSLDEVLKSNLAGTGLFYYIDEHRNVFITENPILTSLPETAQAGLNASDPYSQQTIQNGNQYFLGRGPETVREITIGSRDSIGQGNQAVLYGKIADAESGEAMIGATIYFEELQIGTVTDVNGRYRMVLSPGTYQTRVSCLGMRPLSYVLEIFSDGALDIQMQTELVPIDEVVIEADRYQNTRGMQMGFVKLDIKKIKEIPVIMGERDLVRVALMLPGIQSVGEGSSGVNVRGSSADQNMFYINKVPVYNTAHMFGFFSAFNPDIVKEFEVMKSNVPVEYGGRLSSYFNISTRDGNKQKLSGRGGISPVTGHMAVDGPLKKGKHSFLLGARTTYSDWMLKRMEDPDIRNSSASFYDLAGSLNLEPNDHNLVKIFGHYTRDQFGYSDLFSHEYSNKGASVDWRHRITPSLSSDLSAVFGTYEFININKENLNTAYEHDYRIGHYQANAGFSWVPHSQHVFSFGANMIRYELNRGRILPFGEESDRRLSDLGDEQAIEGALYLGDKFAVMPWLTISGGLRYGFYSMRGPAEVYEYYSGVPRAEAFIRDTLMFGAGANVKSYHGPELRFAANFSTGVNSSIKVSYNRIRQYLFLLSNTIAISPTDQWKLCDYHISPPYVDHVSAGYYKDFPESGLRTSLEVYLKEARDVVEYKDGADFIASRNIEQDVLQGNQKAWGLEMMLEKPSGKLNGWLAYTWSSSRMLVNGAQPWEKINEGLAYPSNYDKPHALNLLLNYRFSRRLSLSSTMVYNTGRPATYPVSIYQLDGQEIVQYSRRNAYRVPDYFRTDLSINLEGNLKARKLIHSFWMLNFYNLTSRRNAYSVYFLSENGKIRGYKMSVFGNMIVTVSWNFKFGNYATE